MASQLMRTVPGQTYNLVGEQSRRYIFPTGQMEVKNVEKITVRSTGTHRLETREGMKYIIPTGWLGIEIKSNRWSA